LTSPCAPGHPDARPLSKRGEEQGPIARVRFQRFDLAGEIELEQVLRVEKGRLVCSRHISSG